MGDVSEIQEAKKWIKATLQANADITGAVGTRVYADRVPARVTLPYVLFNFLGGTDVQAVGTARESVRPLFQIRVVSDGAPNTAARLVDKRIDDVLQVTRASTSGEFLFSARREQSVDRPEYDTATNHLYHNLGGLFRLWISKA